MENAQIARENSTVSFRLRIADILLLLTIIVLSALPYICRVPFGGDSSYRILVSDLCVAQGDFKTDTTFTVGGLLGEVTITIADGKIGIDESYCPNRHCILTGYTNFPHKPIVCVPNRLIIEVIGQSKEGYDAILR